MISRRDRRLPAATRDSSPLAGVQGKIALTRLRNGRFALPKTDRNAPTTHILKVPRPRGMSDVAAEHLTTRFDRVLDGKTVSRPHQEARIRKPASGRLRPGTRPRSRAEISAQRRHGLMFLLQM